MLSDVLSDDLPEIERYRLDETYDHLYKDLHPKLDKLMCEMIVMRAELDKSPNDHLPLETLPMYAAAKRGDYQEYRRCFVERVSLLAKLAAGGELKRSDVRAARRLIPFQNLFYLRWMLTQMQDEVADELEAKGR
jgi:hypothetical protein